MTALRWYAPVDPECPAVIEHAEFQSDPITVMSGCGDEFAADFERRHRKTCGRCREYGAANIEVVYG